MYRTHTLILIILKTYIHMKAMCFIFIEYIFIIYLFYLLLLLYLLFVITSIIKN